MPLIATLSCECGGHAQFRVMHRSYGASFKVMMMVMMSKFSVKGHRWYHLIVRRIAFKSCWRQTSRIVLKRLRETSEGDSKILKKCSGIISLEPVLQWGSHDFSPRIYFQFTIPPSLYCIPLYPIVSHCIPLYPIVFNCIPCLLSMNVKWM